MRQAPPEGTGEGHRAGEANAQRDGGDIEIKGDKDQSKGGENGKLFGSVTSMEIAEEVKKQHGIDIDRRKIVLDEPIKQYGSYELTAKLGYDINATLMVIVTE